MMKRFRKVAYLPMVMLLMFGCLVQSPCGIAFASELGLENTERVSENENVRSATTFAYQGGSSGLENVNNPVCLSDQYGYTNWPSLGAAMSYYGTDYTYTYCGGSLYNYYFCFSDGSRMFFGVLEK